MKHSQYFLSKSDLFNKFMLCFSLNETDHESEARNEQI